MNEEFERANAEAKAHAKTLLAENADIEPEVLIMAMSEVIAKLVAEHVAEVDKPGYDAELIKRTIQMQHDICWREVQ